MDRIWLAALGVVLLLTPLSFGTALGLTHRTVSMTADEVPAESVDASTTDVVRADRLPPDERSVAEGLASGESVHVELYRLELFGEPVLLFTTGDGGVRAGTARWPGTLATASYLRVDGGHYLLERWSRDSAVLRTLQSDHPFANFLAFVPLSAVFVYVGLRPDYR